MHDSYKEKHPKPIPIGHQEYGYQCEDVIFDFLRMENKLYIKGYGPNRRGSLPYPNEEKDLISKYKLKLKQQYNGIEIVLEKEYKDGSKGFYVTTISFSQFVNRLFEGHPASSWIREAPRQDIDFNLKNSPYACVGV